MKNLIWLAALTAIGCSTNVRQAPAAGLPELRPAKQHQGDFEYPPPPSDEDINAGGNGPVAQDFEFQVNYESWPGTWLMDGPEDGVIHAINLNTSCQLTLVLEFKSRGTAKEKIVDLRDNILSEHFDDISPIRNRSLSEVFIDFSGNYPSLVGRLTVRTYPDVATGLATDVIALCPPSEAESPATLSRSVIDSISLKRAD